MYVCGGRGRGRCVRRERIAVFVGGGGESIWCSCIECVFMYGVCVCLCV